MCWFRSIPRWTGILLVAASLLASGGCQLAGDRVARDEPVVAGPAPPLNPPRSPLPLPL